MASSVHSSAVEADLLQQMSVLHHNYVERNEVQTMVLQNVFATAFFVIKEFIANRKMIPLISFMENVLGMSQLKHFSHHSQGSVRNLFSSWWNCEPKPFEKGQECKNLWHTDRWSYRHISVNTADLFLAVLQSAANVECSSTKKDCNQVYSGHNG